MAPPRARAAAAADVMEPNAPAQQPVSRAAPAEQDVRAPQGRAVAIGRDGKPIWRQTTDNGDDPYDVRDIDEAGWTRQWKRYSIFNQQQSTYQTTLARVGKWTPVLKEQYPGRFDQPGATGIIVHEGLILMERPTILQAEAEREEKRAADAAVNKAKSERGLAAASAGVDVNTPAARNATYIKTSRVAQDAADQAALSELPRGKYDYDRQSID